MYIVELPKKLKWKYLDLKIKPIIDKAAAKTAKSFAEM